MKNLGILVSGRGSNMRAIIDACESGRVAAEVVLVISNNADSLALQTAQEKHIATVHLSSRTHPDARELDKAMLRALQDAEVELVVLAGFMKKIGPLTLKNYKGRIINIHPSLLPDYGGKGMFGIHVHEAVLENKEQQTGVTIHLVDGEYDQGAILAQQTVPVKKGDDASTLASRVLQVEHRLYVETIQKIIDGSIILPS
ncbi:MAG: phosphoribosylglycinamide formyltransferase [Gammaproteobacteria bacterium]